MFIITTSLSTTGERIGLLQNSQTKRNCSNDGAFHRQSQVNRKQTSNFSISAAFWENDDQQPQRRLSPRWLGCFRWRKSVVRASSSPRPSAPSASDSTAPDWNTVTGTHQYKRPPGAEWNDRRGKGGIRQDKGKCNERVKKKTEITKKKKRNNCYNITSCISYQTKSQPMFGLFQLWKKSTTAKQTSWIANKRTATKAEWF